MSTYIILLAGKCNFLRRLTDREDDKNKEKGNITKLITRVVPNSRNTKSTCNVVHGKKSTLTSSNWPVQLKIKNQPGWQILRLCWTDPHQTVQCAMPKHQLDTSQNAHNEHISLTAEIKYRQLTSTIFVSYLPSKMAIYDKGRDIKAQIPVPLTWQLICHVMSKLKVSASSHTPSWLAIVLFHSLPLSSDYVHYVLCR